MPSKGVESLSGKQLQCLELVGEGYASAEIEGLLGISANTVNTHISLAVQKLGAPNRMHAARMLREYRSSERTRSELPENMTSQILRPGASGSFFPGHSRRSGESCTMPSSPDASSNPFPSSPFLSNAEAARFRNLSLRTLEKLRVIGGGPQFRKLGRRVMYTIEELDAWAAMWRCDSTSDPAWKTPPRNS